MDAYENFTNLTNFWLRIDVKFITNYTNACESCCASLLTLSILVATLQTPNELGQLSLLLEFVRFVRFVFVYRRVMFTMILTQGYPYPDMLFLHLTF